jgi:maltose alpha-D-glucosyltransferase/alpha-amylase
LLAEANQWPEDVQAYFGDGDGDECHMLFHFPLMPRLYMAIAQEDRFPILDILRQTPETPALCQWAVFLRNHDELTLEMVTDKERDYLWKTYAADRRARLNLGIRRRLAPLLERDRRRIELMNSLLLTILGTPILYYGDEIGMGDNVHLGDRDGVRTPMQWTPDRNGGFSRADPAALVAPVIMDPLYGYQAVNVEVQTRDPYSLLNWVRRMLAIRAQRKAFGRGTIRFLQPHNRKILAYLRACEGEDTVLCVANLSRTAQAVELDLAEFTGLTPVELSGDVAFPKIGQLTYLLTLPPFGFYWFKLSAETQQPDWSTSASGDPAELQTFVIRKGLGDVLQERPLKILEKEVLPAWLLQRRWFPAKSGGLPETRVEDTIFIEDDLAYMVLEAGGQRYALPLALSWEDSPSDPFETALALARVRRGSRMGLLTDGFAKARFARAILRGLEGEVVPGFEFHPAPGLAPVAPDAAVEWPAAEQSNSSLIVGRTAVIKVLRKLVEGIHPEIEMGRVLTERGFGGIAALMGTVTRGDATVAIVQRYVENQGDAFQWSLETVDRSLDDTAVEGDPADAPADFAVYRHFIEVAGRRLGEMHSVLAQPTEDPDFSPEIADAETISRWREQLRKQLDAAFRTREMKDHDRILAAAEKALENGEGTTLTRIHGDFHLGQVLVSGDDAILIDFEGEPGKPLAERRARNAPLRDVAGMLRSFDYVAALLQRREPVTGIRRGIERERELLGTFRKTAQRAFLRGYVSGRGRPLDEREQKLLDVFTLEKAAYEIVYEANNRPDWIDVPLSGFLELAEAL